MYLDFYKMKEQPFGVTPDPRFLYLGKSHREALASLYYGIESDRGFVALIAPPGLGKTTLTFQLLEKLQEESRTVFLFQTQCNAREFFHYLLNGLGVDAEGMELVSMHNKLNEILAREMLAGHRFILAIDEAQNLEPEVLESIRLLSNFETPQAKLLQILLIGQPQLARKLASPELEQFQQRISVFAKLEPFSFEETGRYIAHRLQVAGYGGGPLFSPGALRIIAEQSQGIPRKINALCFSALSLAFAKGRKQVDVAMMEEVVADRDVESFQRPKVTQRIVPAPAAARPTLTSYSPARSKKSFARWALGTSTVAACLAMAIGMFFFSPSRNERTIKSISETWASVRSLVTTRQNSVPHSSPLDVQAADLPSPAPTETAISHEDLGIITVFVQPGETLRQIVLRTTGEYNVDTIEQTWKLNPDISDFDHLDAGQSIRIPRVSAPMNSLSGAEAADAAEKNRGTRLPR